MIWREKILLYFCLLLVVGVRSDSNVTTRGKNYLQCLQSRQRFIDMTLADGYWEVNSKKYTLEEFRHFHKRRDSVSSPLSHPTTNATSDRHSEQVLLDQVGHIVNYQLTPSLKKLAWAHLIGKCVDIHDTVGVHYRWKSHPHHYHTNSSHTHIHTYFSSQPPHSDDSNTSFHHNIHHNINHNYQQPVFAYSTYQQLCHLFQGGNVMIVGDSINHLFHVSLISWILYWNQQHGFFYDENYFSTHDLLHQKEVEPLLYCPRMHDHTKKSAASNADNTANPKASSDKDIQQDGYEVRFYFRDDCFAEAEWRDASPYYPHRAQWSPELIEKNISVLILNRGPHYKPDDVVLQSLTKTFDYLTNNFQLAHPPSPYIQRKHGINKNASNVNVTSNGISSMNSSTSSGFGSSDDSSDSDKKGHPRLTVIYRDTAAGHPTCVPRFNDTPLTAPISIFQLLKEDPQYQNFHWQDLDHQNHLIKRLIDTNYPWITYMNVSYSTSLRLDGHSISNNGDCLHYCLGGPLNHWIEKLLQTLWIVHQQSPCTVEET